MRTTLLLTTGTFENIPEALHQSVEHVFRGVFSGKRRPQKETSKQVDTLCCNNFVNKYEVHTGARSRKTIDFFNNLVS